MSQRTLRAMGISVITLALVLLIALWVIPAAFMRPSQVGVDELANIPIDGEVSVVGLLKDIQGDSLIVEILEGQDYDQPSGKLITIFRSEDERIVMGNENDVFVGAVAQFEGIKTAESAVRLGRIVILTGYVKGP